MATSEKKKAYDRQYNDSHVRQIKFSFSLQYDADILAKLDAVPNKQGYIKDLIRADIARKGTAQKEEEKTMKENNIWYAVMTDSDDTDWGTGSFDKNEALEMALKNADIYPDSYIAVIDDTSAEKVCIAEIHSIAPSYRIQPEYLDRWGAENPDTVVSASEVVSLSHDWGTPVEELLGQLIID